jgi:hypothetical protein
VPLRFSLAALQGGLFAAVLLGSAPAHARPSSPGIPPRVGQIAGRVLDAATGEGLPGANVLVAAPGAGAATDLDGYYTIRGVPAGTYDVTVSFLGFTTKTVTGVEVRDGQTTTLDVVLEEDVGEIEEVVVTAERERGTTAALLAVRRLAPAVVDVVSRTDIQIAGSDAAAAVSRTPAAEVADGKYIRVRGFGDRYSNLTLNGIPIPSITPDRREVPLDLFPAAALESARVVKGYTPDLPADFVGGLVQLYTRDTPPGRVFSFSAKSSYNTASSLQENVYLGGCTSAWTGFSDCYDDYPAAFFDGRSLIGRSPEDDLEATYETLQNPRPPEEIEALGEAVAAAMPYAPEVRTAPLDQSYGLTYGDRFDVLGRRFGVIAVGTYDQTWSARRDYVERIITSAADSSGVRRPAYPVDYEGRAGERSVRVGAVVNLGYAVSDASRLRATTVYNRTTDDLARVLEGYLAADQKNVFIPQLRRLVSQLLTTRLAGEHRLPLLADNATLDWQVAYSRTSRFEPGTRAPVYQQDADPVSSGVGYVPEPGLPFRYYESNEGRLGAALHQDQADDGYAAGLDATFPFRALGRAVVFKTGGLADYRARDVYTRRIFFASEDFSNLTLEPGFDQLPPDLLHTPEFIVARDETTVGVTPVEVGRAGDSYVTDATVLAAYVLLDVELLPGLRAVGGARLEDGRQDGRAFGNFGEQFADASTEQTWAQHSTDLLPSIALTYAPMETMNVRVGAARTLARPQFRELSPITFYDFFGGITSTGNAELERVLITNADARWEWFPDPESVVSAGAFYKGFGRPIEAIWQGDGDRTWVNTGRARAYGFETEVRTPLGRLTPLLRDVTVNANLTLMYSEVNPFVFRDDAGNPRRIPADERPVFGQTPYLFNAIVTYTAPQLGTALSALFQATGRRLEVVSNGPFRPAIYESPRAELDLVLAQPLGRGMTLNASARRLLGSEVSFEQTFESGETLKSTAYERGSVFSLGLTWSPYD